MSSYILGIATQYPAIENTADDTEAYFRKWAKPSIGLEKTCKINRATRILKRPHVSALTDPSLNQPTPPTIKTVNTIFMDKGVELAVQAAKKALKDWGGRLEDITHLVCNTCTASAYPGFDHALLMALGLPLNTDRTLLHGVGCAGGLSALRLANQFSLIPSTRPPRVLVVATEVTSTLVRSELEELDRASTEKNGVKAVMAEMGNVGVCLFSDGASALVVGGGKVKEDEKVSFEIEQTLTETLPDTVPDLGFNVDECGWKAIISPRVPSLTSKAVPAMYHNLLQAASLKPTPPSFITSETPTSTPAPSLDWLIHPGGASILAKIEQSLSLSPTDHTRASWEVYVNKGNTSSVSIGAVMERSRMLGGREGCVAVSFGPGVTVEGALLRRTGWRGREVEALRAAKANGHANGHTNGVKRKIEGVEGNGNGHTNGTNGNHDADEPAKKKISLPTPDQLDQPSNSPGKFEHGTINGEVNGIINGAQPFTRKNPHPEEDAQDGEGVALPDVNVQS